MLSADDAAYYRPSLRAACLWLLLAAIGKTAVLPLFEALHRLLGRLWPGISATGLALEAELFYKIVLVATPAWLYMRRDNATRHAARLIAPEGRALPLTVLAAVIAVPFAAALAPIQSVGVQGDHRSYRSLVILSGAGLTPDVDTLYKTAKTIPNELKFVNRVAYLLNRREVGGTLHSVRSRICREEADLLREADAIVTSEIMRPMADGKCHIAQCFAVLLPVGVGDKFSIAVRAVVTNDFMTAQSAVPGVDFPEDALANIVRRIEAAGLPVDMILYDVTGKPPATVEWE